MNLTVQEGLNELATLWGPKVAGLLKHDSIGFSKDQDHFMQIGF